LLHDFGPPGIYQQINKIKKTKKGGKYPLECGVRYWQGLLPDHQQYTREVQVTGNNQNLQFFVKTRQMKHGLRRNTAQ
jgi:hypothetical protein